jgi:hypothetical protein
VTSAHALAVATVQASSQRGRPRGCLGSGRCRPLAQVQTPSTARICPVTYVARCSPMTASAMSSGRAASLSGILAVTVSLSSDQPDVQGVSTKAVCDRVYPNVGAEHRREQSGQMVNARLADGVGDRAPERALPTERCDVQDVSVAAGPQERDCGRRDVPGAEHVDLEDATPDLARRPGQVSVRHLCRRAGVVDDEVELSVALHRGYDELSRLVLISHICLEVPAPDLVGDGLSLCDRRLRVDDDGPPGGAEPSCDCGTDAGRGACE